MNNIYDVIIIGAGPSGLTSAIYLARSNKKVLVLEGNNYGGVIINSLNIENYPACPNISGFDFANKLYEQAKALGTNILFEKVVSIKNSKIKKVITTKNTYSTRSIIIATGCENRKLNLLNEDEFIGKGISYCATCDGNFYKGKTVAVVGGGNTAIYDAIYLSNICKKVYLIHRRSTFRAFDESVELLKEKDNVYFILNSTITKLNGKNNLVSIVVSNKKETKTISVDGLFVAIGQNPNTNEFKNIIKLNQDGYIISKNMCTNRKGIFVAGDVREKIVRQLVTATSDGCQASFAAINYLNKE